MSAINTTLLNHTKSWVLNAAWCASKLTGHIIDTTIGSFCLPMVINTFLWCQMTTPNQPRRRGAFYDYNDHSRHHAFPYVDMLTGMDGFKSHDILRKTLSREDPMQYREWRSNESEWIGFLPMTDCCNYMALRGEIGKWHPNVTVRK